MDIGKEMTNQKPSETQAEGTAKPDNPPVEGGKGSGRVSRIPWLVLPERVRKVLQKVPSKKWYQITAFHATHPGSQDLAEFAPILNYVLEAAPHRLWQLGMAGTVSPEKADAGFRKIRDAFNGYREAVREVAELANLKVWAWQEPAIEKRSVAGKPGRHPSAFSRGANPGGARPSGARPGGTRPGGTHPPGAPVRPALNSVTGAGPKAVITRKLHRGEDVPQATLVRNGLI